MRRFLPISAMFLVGLSQTVFPVIQLHSQAVHRCCTVKDCRQREVKPNLRLAQRSHLFGFLADQTGQDL